MKMQQHKNLDVQSSAERLGLNVVDVFSDIVQVTKEIEIELCGIAVENELQQVITGSAGALLSASQNNNGITTQERALMEVQERVAIQFCINVLKAETRRQNHSFSCFEKNIDEAQGRYVLNPKFLFPSSSNPKMWEYSKSNGMALHTSWESACLSAACELVERDMILRAWFGESLPMLVNGFGGLDSEELNDFYEIYTLSFGKRTVVNLEKDLFVHGCFFIPKDKKYPFICGFGCADSVGKSIIKAEQESLQRLGFLWDESLPLSLPNFMPHSGFHQEYYLFSGNHGVIRDFLLGKFFEKEKSKVFIKNPIKMEFFDLTPGFFGGDFYLAKATCDDCIPLIFGKTDIAPYDKLPEQRRIHLIS